MNTEEIVKEEVKETKKDKKEKKDKNLEKIAELEEEKAKLQDALLRSQAEFINFRKRLEEEKTRMLKFP